MHLIFIRHPSLGLYSNSGPQPGQSIINDALDRSAMIPEYYQYLIVCYSNHGLNSKLSVYQTPFNHSNTGLVLIQIPTVTLKYCPNFAFLSHSYFSLLGFFWFKGSKTFHQWEYMLVVDNAFLKWVISKMYHFYLKSLIFCQIN